MTWRQPQLPDVICAEPGGAEEDRVVDPGLLPQCQSCGGRAVGVSEQRQMGVVVARGADPRRKGARLAAPALAVVSEATDVPGLRRSSPHSGVW